MPFISYQNSPTNNTMREGDYECILKECGIGYTQTSKIECINCKFVVRDDVEQAYQRKCIFKRFYRNDKGEWPMEKIGKMANALGIEKDSSFELADLVGLCCILHVRPWAPDGGEPRDTITYYAPTKAGQMILGAANTELQDVTEEEADELPF